jgi:ABC-type nitrate/sulfonate/bicarbonate transport system permease component
VKDFVAIVFVTHSLGHPHPRRPNFITAPKFTTLRNRLYELLRHVLVPGALPVILTGLRMGFTVALLSIIGSETIASLAGLGHRIVHLAESMDMARMFAYIVFVIAIAATLNRFVSWLEARGRWQ